jgi:RNA methyltransferase, TrmH family
MRSDATIRSRENPLLKRVGAVLAGREAETLALEGDRLVDDALAAGLVLETILVSDAREARAQELGARATPVRRVADDVLRRVSRLKAPPGIIALCATPASRRIEELALGPTSLLLAVDGIADPGNLGALARSAEAFGASALCVSRGGASPWNEKALRGSMGSLLRLPVVTGLERADIAAELRRRNVWQVCGATRGGADPATFDWRGPIALWISGETGMEGAEAQAFERLTIPIAPAVESLNVTVAASLLLYCARSRLR